MNQTELFSQKPPTSTGPLPVRRVPVPLEPLDPVVEGAAAKAQVGYIVRLADYGYPMADVAKVSVQRFRRELDRQLGDDVGPALRAYRSVSESGEGDLSLAEVQLATRWAKAYTAARDAGFREMGDTDEAFFEIRLV